MLWPDSSLVVDIATTKISNTVPFVAKIGSSVAVASSIRRDKFEKGEVWEFTQFEQKGLEVTSSSAFWEQAPQKPCWSWPWLCLWPGGPYLQACHPWRLLPEDA